MAKMVFNLTFTGDVFSLHAFLSDHETPMVQQGATWSGTQTIDVVGDSVLLAFRFISPPPMAWTIALDSKVAGTTASLWKDNGVSDAARFAYTKSVLLKEAAGRSEADRLVSPLAAPAALVALTRGAAVAPTTKKRGQKADAGATKTLPRTRR